MKRKTLMSWSSGKDSAWALYKLQQDPEIDLKGLFCTVNNEFNRVAMHAVRVDLLKRQAKVSGFLWKSSKYRIRVPMKYMQR
jgi:diphthamide synthase (EF-2-diphthine--ammonia ligase)